MDRYQEIKQQRSDLVAGICATIRARGRHINQPRKAVIYALVSQQQAMTAEALWLGIRATHKISISAVYSNLNLLVEEGVVEKMQDDDAKSTYQVKTSFKVHGQQSN